MARPIGSTTLLLTALLAVSASAPGARAQAIADLAIVAWEAPSIIRAGVSATYAVTVRNDGSATAPLEFFIIFAGAFDQTGQIRPQGGLECSLGEDVGINAVIRCTAPQLPPGAALSVLFQGRGLAPGTGDFVVTIDPGGTVFDSFRGNNFMQFSIRVD